jgi:hypothetical protein
MSPQSAEGASPGDHLSHAKALAGRTPARPCLRIRIRLGAPRRARWRPVGGRPRADGGVETPLSVTGREGGFENGDDVPVEPPPEKAARSAPGRTRAAGRARRGFPCRRSRARGPSSTWRDSLHSGTFAVTRRARAFRGYRSRVPNRPFHRPKAASIVARPAGARAWPPDGPSPVP